MQEVDVMYTYRAEGMLQIRHDVAVKKPVEAQAEVSGDAAAPGDGK